jgi:hypothetical protein
MQAADPLPTPIPGLPNPDGCYPNFTTAEGCNALAVLTGGIGNTAVGWYSLFLAGDASFNTGVGAGALALTTRTGTGVAGDDNTAVGTAAMLLNTAGHDNTANGTDALLFNEIASFNCAIGSFALFNNDNTGHGVANDNIAVGFGALSSNNDGADNTAVGFNALANNQASGLTAVGAGALSGNDSAVRNTAVGFQALFNNDVTRHGVAIGNTAVGASALLSNTDGAGNTADGASALMDNVIGSSNTAVGVQALEHNTNDFNTAVGFSALGLATAGLRNTAVGDAALENLVSGHDNIAIGVDAGSSLTGSESLNIDIGNFGATGDGSTIRIGSVSLQTATFIAGINGNGPFGATVQIDPATGQLGTNLSSARFKKDIDPMDKSSEVIFSLKPVTFHYKKDKTNTQQWGLIAEEVAKVNPALIAADSEGKPYTVRYDQVNAMLLNEFLKEHRTVQEQGATIAQLKSTVGKQEAAAAKQEATIARQQKQIEALTTGLQKVSAQLELSKAAPQTVLNNK